MKRFLVLPVLVLLAVLVAPIASAHTFTATITCRQVTYSFQSFPSGSHSLIHEQVTIDGAAVVTQDFTLSGSSGGNTIAIDVPAGTHTVAASANWTADGGGGNTYSKTLSGCQPTLTTAASGWASVGGAIHDTAHLSGGVGTLSGTISFDIYDSSCRTKLATVAAKSSVNGAGDYVSADYTPAAAGGYNWVAHYSGDSNNDRVDGTCGDVGESSVVDKAGPSISTQLSATSIRAGGSVSDSAVLSGASATAGGSVTYTVYANTSCTGTPRSAGTVTVANGKVSGSNALVFASVGDYYWQASYSGDANNKSALSPCTAEHLVVDKATPGLSTSASGPVTTGNAVHDTAHLSGGSNPTGTISFDVYDAACQTKLATVAAAVAVNGAGDYASASYMPAAAGTYKWVAHYSGDGNNVKLDSSCGDAGETSTVTPPPGGGGGGGGGGDTPTPAPTPTPTPTATVNAAVATTPAPIPSAPRPAVKAKPKPKLKKKPKHAFKPPKVVRRAKPAPVPCYSIAIAPKNLHAGSTGWLRLQVTGARRPIAGTRLSIKGAGLLVLSGRTNHAGKVTVKVHPRQAGLVSVRSASHRTCTVSHVGVVGTVTPPVTG